MRKYVKKMFIYIILFIVLCSKSCEAAVKDIKKGDLYIFYNTYEHFITGQDEADVVKTLREDYGYTGQTLKSPLRVSTKVEIIEEKGNYRIKLGKRELAKIYIKDSKIKSSHTWVKEKTLRDSYGKLQKGTSWDVVIEGVTDGPFESKATPRQVDDGLVQIVYYDYVVEATKVYTGDDAKRLWMTQPEGAQDVDANDSSMYDNVVSVIETGEVVAEFLSHIIESVVTAFLDVIITIGDVFQTIANAVQTGMDNIDIMYTPDELKAADKRTTAQEKDDPEKANIAPMDNPRLLNSYVNFTEGTSSGYDVSIKEKDEDGQSHEFTDTSPIPVIRTDIYTLATNKVNFTKANFLVKDDTEGVIWVTIRNFVASIIHGLMYIIAAILLISMLWHGVGLVKSSISGSLDEKRQHMSALQKIEIAFLMLVGTIIIEALCMYLSDIIFTKVNLVGGVNKYEGPIRVAVQDNIYTFSTTPTGYVRYMASLTNIYLYGKKALYVFAYIGLALANFFLALGMIVRMFFMMFLAVIGFIIIGIYALKAKNASTNGYKAWIKVYAIISFIQVILAILARLLLETILKQ